jgi:hypothetical protein
VQRRDCWELQLLYNKAKAGGARWRVSHQARDGTHEGKPYPAIIFVRRGTGDTFRKPY